MRFTCNDQDPRNTFAFFRTMRDMLVNDNLPVCKLLGLDNNSAQIAHPLLERVLVLRHHHPGRPPTRGNFKTQFELGIGHCALRGHSNHLGWRGAAQIGLRRGIVLQCVSVEHKIKLLPRAKVLPLFEQHATYMGVFLFLTQASRGTHIHVCNICRNSRHSCRGRGRGDIGFVPSLFLISHSRGGGNCGSCPLRDSCQFVNVVIGATSCVQLHLPARREVVNLGVEGRPLLLQHGSLLQYSM